MRKLTLSLLIITCLALSARADTASYAATDGASYTSAKLYSFCPTAALPAWSGGSLAITHIDENIENVTYSGSAPGGANQWQAEVRSIADGGAGDTQTASTGSPVVINPCDIPFVSSQTPCEMRARFLSSGTPVSDWSAWQGNTALDCI